jgi:hypothetical protein
LAAKYELIDKTAKQNPEMKLREYLDSHRISLQRNGDDHCEWERLTIAPQVR